jgi:ribosomal protein S18 acetylase RimI-like enzyme
MDTHVLDHLKLRLTACIRPAEEGDLGPLEWCGMFTPHREIIRQTWEATRRGEAEMLVAVANRFPVGQTWIDFSRYAADRIGLLWAVRVLPGLHRLGIGTRLLAAAERLVREREWDEVEIQVDPANTRAQRLYERQGYRLHDRIHEKLVYTRPDGTTVRSRLHLLRLRKALPPPELAA